MFNPRKKENNRKHFARSFEVLFMVEVFRAVYDQINDSLIDWLIG